MQRSKAAWGPFHPRAKEEKQLNIHLIRLMLLSSGLNESGRRGRGAENPERANSARVLQQSLHKGRGGGGYVMTVGSCLGTSAKRIQMRQM